MTTKEILQDARDWITPRKRWMKGDFSNGHGAYCAVGSIERSARKNGLHYGSAHDAINALARVVPGGSVPRYNDAKDTSHDCILAAFDAAIEKAKA